MVKIPSYTDLYPTVIVPMSKLLGATIMIVRIIVMVPTPTVLGSEVRATMTGHLEQCLWFL